MELTEKAKEEFEKWYNNDIKKQTHKLIHVTDSRYFNLLTGSMQYGVYVDFFWHVGGELILISESVQVDILNGFTTIEEARERVIKKANEIFNNR